MVLEAAASDSSGLVGLFSRREWLFSNDSQESSLHFHMRCSNLINSLISEDSGALAEDRSHTNRDLKR